MDDETDAIATLLQQDFDNWADAMRQVQKIDEKHQQVIEKHDQAIAVINAEYNAYIDVFMNGGEL